MLLQYYVKLFGNTSIDLYRERRLEVVEIVNQEVEWISKDEVRTAMKRMKSGKAVGPDGIPVEAWKCLGEMADGSGVVNQIV